MEIVFQKFSEIISTLMMEEDFVPRSELYLQGDYPWDADSIGAALIIEEEDWIAKQPELLEKYSLKHTLPMSEVFGILYYAHDGIPTVSINQIVDLFNHYYKYGGLLPLR